MHFRISDRKWKHFGLLLLVMTLSSCEQQSTTHDKRAQFLCQQNLPQLYAAIKHYAQTHQNRLPDDWAGLVKSGSLPLPPGKPALNPLVCPGSTIEASDLPSSKEEWLDWIAQDKVSYLLITRGQQLNVDQRKAIVAEKPGNHLNGRRFVLFSDGSVTPCTDEEIAKHTANQ